MQLRIPLWKRIRAFIYRNDLGRCSYCGQSLSVTEIHYYGNKCESCERKIQEYLNSEYDD